LGNSVLVAVAGRGLVRPVAATVEAALAARGLKVEVRPATTVRSLNPYGAVVVGSSARFGRLHRDGRRFLRRHRDGLVGLPVAIFVIGRPSVGDRSDVLPLYLRDSPELEPVTTVHFPGGSPSGLVVGVDRAQLRVDPHDVRRWAQEVAREFGA
jgi:menaquinone-dependent protoporphyrinogen oxidase